MDEDIFIVFSAHNECHVGRRRWFLLVQIIRIVISAFHQRLWRRAIEYSTMLPYCLARKRRIEAIDGVGKPEPTTS